MKMFHNRVYRVAALLICGLVVNIIIASLLLAKWDASVYPGNLYAGPVYLGNMTRTGALHKLQDDKVTASLAIDCMIGQDIYSLKLRDLGIKLDAGATLDKIDSYIEDWSLLGHSLNRGKKQVVSPVWEYDYDRLRQSMNNLALSKHKEPVDARVMLIGDSLLHQPEQYGAQIVPDIALESLVSALNEGQLKVILGEKQIPPAITLSQIIHIKELLSVQAVPVASKNQAVNRTSWAVPGRIIMPGKTIAIDFMLDASDENGQETVAEWHEALSMAAEEAGLVYNAADQELENRTDQPVALFLTQEKELGLIRIYGQQKNPGSKITTSRTYKPLLISAAAAGGQEKSSAGEKLYRHRFIDGQLQATEQLVKSAVAVSETDRGRKGSVHHK